MPERSTRLGILVGVDGSSCSKTAVRWAAAEAAIHRVPLTVVHVLHTPDAGWSGWGLSTAPMPADFSERQQEYARQVIADAIATIGQNTGDKPPLHIAGEVLLSPVIPTLVDLAKDAQMIVVGSRGMHGVRRFVQSSVPNAVSHAARRNVLIVATD